MLSPDIIQRLSGSPDFHAFKGWLLTQVDDIDTVDGLEDLSNERAGEEAKVRSLCKKKIILLLKPFVNSGNARQPSAEEVNAAKQRVGL